MVELYKQNFRKNKSLYNSVERNLVKKLGKGVPVCHVGSTSIPNMYGKNIIDILIGASSEHQLLEIEKILVDAGYFASPRKDNEHQFFSSTDKETGSGDIHIHLVISTTERYNNFIILREYLLDNKSEALEYSNHKKELTSKGITDRNEYKKIKSEYVAKLLKRAKNAIF